jgi:hypothetical protein
MKTTRIAARWYTAAAVSALLVGFGMPSSSPAGTSKSPAATTPTRAPSASLAPDLIPLPPPGHFVRHVTNRYLPWKPGTRWIYRGFGSEGHERDVVVVMERTKLIEGIKATVVRDVVRHKGHLIERTFDWYAQDRRGRVWYLGENTHAYEDGQVSTEGSWMTGVDGARAGVVMFPHPRIGRVYWQEFYRDHAEDQGKVLDLSTQVSVIAGHYDHVRMTEDTSPLEPRVNEYKFYARGVGVVFELDVSPEQGRVELVRMVKP